MKLNKEKLELAMARKCMDIKDISKNSGLSYSTISQIKYGRGTTPKKVGLLANALNVDVSEILD